jgi:hypothetical protein
MVSIETVSKFKGIREKESPGITALTYADDKASWN